MSSSVGLMSSSSSSVQVLLLEEHGKSLLWLVGAVCAAVGAIGQNLGVNTQKYSFMQNEKKPKNLQQSSPMKQRLWVLGLCFVVIGAICDFVALGFAAQSVVAPIGSLTLVANIFFAHFWLGEHLTKKDIFGTACIVVGAVVAAAFGDHTEILYTADMLMAFWAEPIFLAYMGILCVIMLGLYIMVKKIEPIREEMTLAQERYEEALQKRDQEAMVLEDKILNIVEEVYASWEGYHSFGYCSLSGLFGGQNILFGKMVAELLGATFAGDNQLGNYMTYLMALAMAGTIIAQLHFLAKGLATFDALYVVPIYRCFFIIISTLGGGLFFKEFWRFEVTQWLVFSPAICLTVFGVVLLSQRAGKDKDVRNPFQFMRNSGSRRASIELQQATLAGNGKKSVDKNSRKSVFAQSLQALDVDDDDSALEDGVKSTDHTNRGAHSPMDDDDDDDEEVTITLQRTSSYTGLTGVVLNNSLVNDGGGTVLDTIFMSKKPVEKKKFKKSRFSLALPRGLQRKLDAVNNGKYNGGNLTNVSEGRGGHPFLRPLSGNKEEGKAVDEANTLILEELSSDDDSGGIPGQV